jgi:uncharacterized protein with HEPN domain
MIEAAETVATFIAGRERDALDHDRMLLFALVRAIEILGEAASRLTAETRAVAPAVPWPQIIAMRNRPESPGPLHPAPPVRRSATATGRSPGP